MIWTYSIEGQQQPFSTLWCHLLRNGIGQAPALRTASYEENPVETQTVQMWWPEKKKERVSQKKRNQPNWSDWESYLFYFKVSPPSPRTIRPQLLLPSVDTAHRGRNAGDLAGWWPRTLLDSWEMPTGVSGAVSAGLRAKNYIFNEKTDEIRYMWMKQGPSQYLTDEYIIGLLHSLGLQIFVNMIQNCRFLPSILSKNKSEES